MWRRRSPEVERKTIHLILAAILVAAVAGSTEVSGDSVTLTVGPTDCNYVSISEAVTEAKANPANAYRVLVRAGVYEENVVLDKVSNLTIEGAGDGEVRVKGQSAPYVGTLKPCFLITSSTGISIEQLTISDGRRGLEVRATTGLVLDKCVFEGNRRQAIFLAEGSEATITNCKLNGTKPDLDGTHGQGLNVMDSKAALYGNLIEDNADHGVRAIGATTEISGSANVVRDNKGGDLAGAVSVSILASPPSDGAMDEVTVGVQAMTIAEAVALVRSGGTVWLPAGSYREIVQLYKSVKIAGAGTDNTTIHARSEEWTCVNVATDDVVVFLDGIRLTGGRRGMSIATGPNGVVGLSHVQIDRTGLPPAPGLPLDPYSSGLYVFGQSHVVLRDSKLVDNEWLGIVAYGDASIVIDASSITGCKNTGLWALEQCTVELKNGSVIDKSGFRGIDATGNSRISIAGGSIRENENIGVVARDNPVVIIQDAAVSGNGDTGIWGLGTADLTLERCTVEQNKLHGIDIAEATVATLVDTNVGSNSRSGVVIRGTATLTMDGGGARAHNFEGILCAESGRGELRNVQVVGNEYGIKIEGTGYIEVSDSLVQQNREVGLLITGSRYPEWSAKISATQFDANGTGMQLRGEARAVLSNSSVSGSAEMGINVMKEAFVRLVSTSILSTEKYSQVQIEHSGSAELIQCTIADGTHEGIVILEDGYARLLSCRVERNGGIAGVCVGYEPLHGPGHASATLYDCTITRNAGCGIYIQDDKEGCTASIGGARNQVAENERTEICADPKKIPSGFLL